MTREKKKKKTRVRTSAEYHGGPHQVVRAVHRVFLPFQFDFELFFRIQRRGARQRSGRGHHDAARDGAHAQRGLRLLVVGGRGILGVSCAFPQPRLHEFPRDLAGHAKLQTVREQYGQRDHDFHRLGEPAKATENDTRRANE